jgi:5'-nucleotidase
MRILLTNDDGLRAPGIAAMHEALTDFHGHFGRSLAEETLVVAPLTVQSATSHGVTFLSPLMVTNEFLAGSGPDDRVLGVAVDGRPADCVKLAIANIWPERYGVGSRPDLVISGMNAGANVGINVIYSGTVAAALEAAFLGIPSIAVSLHMGKGQARFDVAARHARTAIEAVLAHGVPPPHTCLSINIPITESETPMPPIRVCPMNTHGLTTPTNDASRRGAIHTTGRAPAASSSASPTPAPMSRSSSCGASPSRRSTTTLLIGPPSTTGRPSSTGEPI